MITNSVINEIYRRFAKYSSRPEKQQIDYFIELLAPMHRISMNEDCVVFEEQDELCPFRRFLLRSLNGIVEFDNYVAFAFRNHILFLAKYSDEMRVHFRAVKKDLTQVFFN